MSTLVAIGILIPATAVYLSILLALDPARKRKPGSWAVIVFCFLGGLLSIPLTDVLMLLNPFTFLWFAAPALDTLYYNILIVGLTEEIAKFAVFALCVRAFRQIHEPQDGVLQAAAVALGFAMVENVLYANWYGLWVLPSRLILATPGHLLYAAIWGSGAAYVMFFSKGLSRREAYIVILFALGLMALTHGLYNSFYDFNLGDLSILLDVITAFGALFLLHYWHEHSPFANRPLSRYREAIPPLLAAIESQPKNYALRRRIAVYYLYAGDHNRAAYHLTKALEVQPRSLMVRFYRGLARFLAGHREPGEKEMRDSYHRMSASTQAVAVRNLNRVVRNHVARSIVRQAVLDDAPTEVPIVRSARLLSRYVSERLREESA
ncbi:MAG: PrsW family glutamic-type intramembrane protease [Spirochaetaceae bacterium]